MWKNTGVALGAGLASALLFVLPAKGTLIAIVLAYFTTLPVIIAALGYGHLSGLVAALVGAVGVSAVVGPKLGIFYAAGLGFPAWFLSYLVMLARPDTAAAGNGGAAKLWFPVGRVVTWAAALSCGLVLTFGAAFMVISGGFEAATRALAGPVAEVLSGSQGASMPFDNTGAATFLVRILPLGMAELICQMLLVNLWLGGRISQMSQRLSRPWPNVPDGLRLPRTAAAVLVATGVASFFAGLDSPGGTAAAVVAWTLGLVFAFQGLATAHVLTRGFAGRPAILTMIYLSTFMLPPAVLALSLLGVIDCVGSLRLRRPPPRPPTKPTGVSPWK
jgi:hypothetical protein